MFKVTIKYCYGDYKDLTTNIKSDYENEAICKAIKKFFGKSAQFYENYELNRDSNSAGGYGQIGKPISYNQHSMITGRVRIDVECASSTRSNS